MIKRLSLAIGLGLLTACQPMTAIQTSQPQATPSVQTTPTFEKQVPNVADYKLANGMRVIIKPQKSPLVLTQIWYKVGSNDEPLGKGGMSHFLEHMMFKESSGIDGDIYDKVVSHFGGSRNAFTNDNVTSYYQLLPANQYPLGLEIEANRMRGLVFDQDKFDKEKEVVKEERRQRTDDNPMGLALEQFATKLFDNAKARPIIGSMDDINGLTIKDLQSWYDTFYYPNNATLIVAGGVELDSAKAWVEKYFGKIEPSTKPLPKTPSLSQKSHRGYQELTTYQEVTVPSLVIAYNVPSVLTAKTKEDSYALALFADVASGGASTRLPKVLVRQKQLLNGIDVGYSSFEYGDDVFYISATPREGVSLEQAKEAILAELDVLMNEPITATDLKKGQVSLETALILQNDSITSQARTLGTLAMMDLPLDAFAKLPQALQKIDGNTIQKVAKQYLVKDNMSVMFVYPKAMEKQAKSKTSK